MIDYLSIKDKQEQNISQLFAQCLVFNKIYCLFNH